MKITTQLLGNMKRLQLIALTAVLAFGGLTVLTPQTVSALGGGDGSASNPWQIADCTQLRSLNTDAAALPDHHYVLTADIDCTSVTFNEINFGNGSSLSGTFDGANHTISNISILTDSDTNGLFEYIEEGTVRDLVIDTATVWGNGSVGILAGTTDRANIENVHVVGGTVTGASQGRHFGGLIGNSLSSHYYNVSTNVTVSAPNNSNVGGLVGYSVDDSIEEAAAYGNVTGLADVGGLVGFLEGSDLSWVHAKGDVVASASGWAYAGGLIGTMGGGRVYDSYARGKVSGLYGTGGLIGSIYGLSEVSHSYSTGEVSLDPEETSGGFIGQFDGEDSSLIDSTTFWDTQTSGYSTSGTSSEVGKTTAEMKTLSTFTDVNWDFDDVPIWGLFPNYNDGYPCHTWEAGCVTDDNNEQPNVTTITSATGDKSITLTVDESCTLSDVSTINAADETTKDAAYTYATGFVKFTATGCDASETLVQLLYHDVSPDELTVRKYNPTNNAYFTIPGASLSEVEDGTLVAYMIEDNGDLDIDNTPGVITDPVGLGSLTVGVPNTGLGGARG